MTTDGWFTVGVHGPPTKETAPHGYAYRRPGHRWTFGYPPGTVNVDAEWYPLPAPPTEPAPAPEPVARWGVLWSKLGACWTLSVDDGRPSETECHEAAAALNALDRDGVCWGEPRPPETLPETGRVLVKWASGGTGIVYAEDEREREREWLGWWPLPTPREGSR